MKRMAVVFALVAAIAMTGCALLGTPGPGVKTFAELTAPEKVVYFEKIYNAQYADAAAMAANPVLTTEQLDVYRAKRAALIKVRPLIASFRIVANAGGIPDAKTEQDILNILNMLTAAAVKAGGAK